MIWAPEIYGLNVPDNDTAIQHLQSSYLNRVHQKAPMAEFAPIKLQARVEHDRMIADCPCGSGVGVTRRWTAFCFECGSKYHIEPTEAA